MKASSSKAKGRRLQDFVRDRLRSLFTKLEDDDIKVAIMGESGEDVKLSPAARKVIPYSFECKNQERLNIWSSLEQAEENCNDRTPVLVFKRNTSKTYVAIDIDSFLTLIKEENNAKRT